MDAGQRALLPGSWEELEAPGGAGAGTRNDGSSIGYEPHGQRTNGTNSRNGKLKKSVQSDSAQFEIDVSRGREGSFEPQMVKKRQRRPPGYDEKVLVFCASGQSTREIKAQLEEIYSIEVSPRR